MREEEKGEWKKKTLRSLVLNTLVVVFATRVGGERATALGCTSMQLAFSQYPT